VSACLRDSSSVRRRTVRAKVEQYPQVPPRLRVVVRLMFSLNLQLAAAKPKFSVTSVLEKPLTPSSQRLRGLSVEGSWGTENTEIP
jgi:hypothetical protein